MSSIGSYWVKVTDDNGCKGSDTAKLVKILPNPTRFLSPDTPICIYSSLQLAPTRSFSKYLWSSGGSTREIKINQPGSYSLQVWDEHGCTGRDTIVFSPKECMEGVFVPNAFTPNGDALNDLFKPQVFGRVENYQFTVYNRYGEVVFTSREKGKGWNGKVMGIVQQSNVFVWTCSYTLAGEKQLQKGTVSLIR